MQSKSQFFSHSTTMSSFFCVCTSTIGSVSGWCASEWWWWRMCATKREKFHFKMLSIVGRKRSINRRIDESTKIRTERRNDLRAVPFRAHDAGRAHTHTSIDWSKSTRRMAEKKIIIKMENADKCNFPYFAFVRSTALLSRTIHIRFESTKKNVFFHIKCRVYYTLSICAGKYHELGEMLENRIQFGILYISQ